MPFDEATVPVVDIAAGRIVVAKVAAKALAKALAKRG